MSISSGPSFDVHPARHDDILGEEVFPESEMAGSSWAPDLMVPKTPFEKQYANNLEHTRPIMCFSQFIL